MAASAMPVLPDDGSRIVWPGSRCPAFSASSIIALAMRSFTEPNGFSFSSLARMRTSGFGDSTETSTSGVLPMSSSTLSWTLAIVNIEPSPPSLPTNPIRFVNNLSDGTWIRPA